METKYQEAFLRKYKIVPNTLIERIGTKYFGKIKSIGLTTLISEEVEKEGIEANDEFYKMLIEALAEGGIKLPENQKIQQVDVAFEIPNKEVSIPKSKGDLQDFKDIVSTDDLRPAMMGVYVSKDGYLVGTDAHKLVKYKSNLFYKEEEDKIIDLKKYIGTNGKSIDFIDAKYPNYDAIIPRNNEHKRTSLNTYAFYNFCKSAINLNKYQTSDIFHLTLLIEGKEYKFNPILFAELLEFALRKGFENFDVEVSESQTRAMLLTFEGGSEGLIMPIYSDANVPRTIPYELDEIQRLFRGGKTAKKTTTSEKKPKKATEKRTEEPFRKFEDKVEDAIYIPRRDIRSVELENNEVLSKNEIIDGIYRTKKKFGMGGAVQSFSSPMLVQGMQGNISGFGTSGLQTFADGGQTTTIQDILAKYKAMESAKTNDDPTAEFLNKSWEGKNLDDYIMYSDKYKRGGKMAKGGIFEHGLQEGDKIVKQVDDKYLIVASKGGVYSVVDIEKGSRFIVGLDDSKTSGKRKSVKAGVKEAMEYINYLKSTKMANGGKFAQGGMLEDAKIYVADLAEYNNGRLVGKWLDLSDYSSGAEVMEAIQEMLDEQTKKDKYGDVHEEYAIHDFEGFPRSFYSESMGESDFDELYEIAKIADSSNLPIDVLMEAVSDLGYEDDPERVAEAYYSSVPASMGNEWRDFAYEYIDSIGNITEAVSKPEYYFDFENFGSDIRMDYTDEELEEMGYNDLSDEELGEQMADEMGGVKNLGEKLIETYFDYDKFGRELEYDFIAVRGKDGDYYFFNRNFAKGGKVKYAKGGEVEEINIAKQYGKMLNDLSKEKQFNKKIELNSKVKNFEKQNEISIDQNNIIYIKGNRIAYIDKINSKTGQQKTNWEIKKFAKGGKIGFEGLAKKVAKRYVGKKVSKEYQAEYGKTYDAKEAKEVGNKVAGKVYKQQVAKKKIVRKLQRKTK